MARSGEPITRYYAFGVTFRWIRGECHIAVKPGYVCEGQAVIAKTGIRSFEVADRPAEEPHNDQHTWIGWIPVTANLWDNDQYFRDTAGKWAHNHPELVQNI